MAGRTFENHYRPLSVRLYNGVARQLERIGWGLNGMTEESILAAARRRTGLAEFQDDDFRVPLRLLIQSFLDDGRLHPFGRMMMRRRLVEFASNRLRIDDNLRRHPEILDEPIRRPLFITGLPRTGTTLLQNLLSLDPASRPLLTWEAFWPSPPTEAGGRRLEPRIKRARALINLTYWLAPRFPVIHPLDPEGPDECVSLTFNTFVSQAFPMMANLTSYEEWLGGLTLDQWTTAYGYYKRQLQLLQWQRNAEHWILKSPMHLAALDALLTVFPDACIVQTHRDPVKAVPSLCSLAATVRAIATNELNPTEIGPKIAATWAAIVEHAGDVRDAAPTHFLDVHYDELIGDPVATAHRIYDHFGYRRSRRMDTAMQDWLARDADKKRTSHRYDLEQFGLDRPTIERLFNGYYQRYGLVPESLSHC
ncbi:MAG: sulfotransferase [Phycisphaerae bacterium]|nr:sulfotransferase [Phycisphaerae bacterium]